VGVVFTSDIFGFGLTTGGGDFFESSLRFVALI